MNYFQASFAYSVSKEQIEDSWKSDPQNTGQHVTSPGESEAILYVDSLVEKQLTELGLDWRHAYSFPDGSCYKFIRSKGTKEELKDLLTAMLDKAKTPYHLHLGVIIVESPDTDPWKVGSATLAEYFEKRDRHGDD